MSYLIWDNEAKSLGPAATLQIAQNISGADMILEMKEDGRIGGSWYLFTYDGSEPKQWYQVPFHKFAEEFVHARIRLLKSGQERFFKAVEKYQLPPVQNNRWLWKPDSN